MAVRLGRSRTRGVVTEVGVEAPPGIAPALVGDVLDEIPGTLVDLALWLADYYGSTPARALELVAPRRRERRARAPVARRAGGPWRRAAARVAHAGAAGAIDRVVAALDEGLGDHLLLAGPTGSGKTEVYLQACAAALERGLGAIVLVPEIALAPQTVGRFRQRFGDTVAMLHSSLSDAERRDERDRVASGAARVVVGARSALFAPLRGLGPDRRRRGAGRRATSRTPIRATTHAPSPPSARSLEGAVAVYGSATPRPRAGSAWSGSGCPHGSEPRCRPCGSSTCVASPDTPCPRHSSPSWIASREERGRAILLLNRRGVAPALHCRACGRSCRCGSCDVALTLHRDGRLHCHHCGSRGAGAHRVPCVRLGRSWPRSAPARSASRPSSPGTLPELELIRLDADVTARARGAAGCARPLPRGRRARCSSARSWWRRGTTSPASLWRRWSTRTPASASRLQGGGAHLPARDPARRAQRPRRAGACGGADLPARRHTVSLRRPPRRRGIHGRGARAERALEYPPFRHLVSLLVSGPEPGAPLQVLRELRDRLGDAGADLLGPAPLIRLRGRHRAQLVAKTVQPRRFARAAAALLAAAGPAMRRDGLTAVVDVDPQSL